MSMEKLAQDLKQRFFYFTGTIRSFNFTKGFGDEKEPRSKGIQVWEGLGVEELVIQSRAKMGPTRPSVPKGKPPGTN